MSAHGDVSARRVRHRPRVQRSYQERKAQLRRAAYLTLEDPDEPFNGGIAFNTIPPRGISDMEQLSGGEKTVAALALLCDLQREPGAVLVLDEVDAALDNVNVSSQQYVKKRSDDFQCVVISLKDRFYEKADALVGTYKDAAKRTSATLTLDLNAYD